MTEYKTLTKKECVDTLLSVTRPLVLMHVRPDGDTVGSGAALCRIFAALGRPAAYACSDRIPERLKFLVEGIECADSTEGYECVSIDAASPSQLGSLYCENILLAIDHHETNTPYAPNYTLGGMSSAGEALYGVARELEERGLISINADIAAPLYAAIASDTGGFAYASATPDTYRAAAALIELGIDHAKINRRLFASKSREQLLAEGFVASKIKTLADGKISYATVTRAEREALGCSPEHFETAIDIVRSVLGVTISFVLRENDAGEYKASLRSTEKSVAEVAKKFSGGGHKLAAGCAVAAGSIDEASELLIAELLKIVD